MTGMHDDEKIRAVLRTESESGDGSVTQSIRDGKVTIGDEIFLFGPRLLLEDKISLCCPAGFTAVKKELVAIKYPSGNRPGIILGNEDATLNLCVNHTGNPMREEMLESIMLGGAGIAERMAPGARILSKTLSKAGEKPIAVVEFVMSGLDMDLYNCFAYAELEGRLLIVSFNCPERRRADWRPYALQIMESLIVCGDAEEEKQCL
jgi:hypothetical protein